MHEGKTEHSGETMKAMDPAGTMENASWRFPQLLGRATPAHRLHNLYC